MLLSRPLSEKDVEPAAPRCMVDCSLPTAKAAAAVMVVVAGFGAIAVFGTFMVRPGWAAPYSCRWRQY